MTQVPSEFSRLVRADRVTAHGHALHLAPSAEEREAIARRLGLVSLDSFTADVRLKRVRGGRVIRVDGDFRAEVVQSCVVTLDPVPQSVEDRFVTAFSPDVTESEDFDPTLSEEDLPEPLEGDTIDVGELVIQHLSLALDPYPRKPGIEFQGYGDDPDEPEAPPSPFGKLATLKRDR